jgi:preprotein translocase subunit SecF
MDVIRYRKLFFGISGALVIVSLIALAIPPALVSGIDFSGGAALTIDFDERPTSRQIERVLDTLGFDEAIIQSTSGNTFFIRLRELEKDRINADGNVTVPGEQRAIEAALASLGGLRVVGSDEVSAVIGAENVRNAIFAVITAAIAILFYVTWAFRRVPSPFRYGMAAIIALLHDVILVLGLFSILGKTIDLEVNAMFITGVLTVIGYSVNDTIVVFDRVRENVVRFPASTIGEVVNLSVRETVGRSLNTSITLLVVILSLLLFAGTSIQPLLFVLATGVVVGTYSSIFIASLTLVAWENGEIGAFFSHVPIIGRRGRRASA